MASLSSTQSDKKKYKFVCERLNICTIMCAISYDNFYNSSHHYAMSHKPEKYVWL